MHPSHQCTSGQNCDNNSNSSNTTTVPTLLRRKQRQKFHSPFNNFLQACLLGFVSSLGPKTRVGHEEHATTYMHVDSRQNTYDFVFRLRSNEASLANTTSRLTVCRGNAKSMYGCCHQISCHCHHATRCGMTGRDCTRHAHELAQ